LRKFGAEITFKMEARMIVGYARCSTEGQDVEGQVATLKAAGADKVYAEKVSGIVTDRKELRRAIASLTCGDLLIVTKLDRLARSTRDLLNTLAAVADKGAGFRVLDNPAMDTKSAHGRLLLKYPRKHC
jgi:DNA invertase Pin-like site-specific DNA recombinase